MSNQKGSQSLKKKTQEQTEKESKMDHSDQSKYN